MDDSRRTKQVAYWEENSTERKPERPSKNLTDTIQQRMKEISSLIWKELLQLSILSTEKTGVEKWPSLSTSLPNLPIPHLPTVLLALPRTAFRDSLAIIQISYRYRFSAFAYYFFNNF